ncbi:hypothetical protein EVA_09701 [gut metagenome]|uniref:Uncharacterized protein n=1 Tax=gut metagenome TaxID=749906 RepID=J9G4Q6_9ZZZZ
MPAPQRPREHPRSATVTLRSILPITAFETGLPDNRKHPDTKPRLEKPDAAEKPPATPVDPLLVHTPSAIVGVHSVPSR